MEGFHTQNKRNRFWESLLKFHNVYEFKKRAEGVMNQKNFLQFGWVKACIIKEYKGLSYDSLKSKIRRNKLIKNVHYKLVDGSYMFNFEAIDQFITDLDGGK